MISHWGARNSRNGRQPHHRRVPWYMSPPSQPFSRIRRMHSKPLGRARALCNRVSCTSAVSSQEGLLPGAPIVKPGIRGDHEQPGLAALARRPSPERAARACVPRPHSPHLHPPKAFARQRTPRPQAFFFARVCLPWSPVVRSTSCRLRVPPRSFGGRVPR
ncbi:hypothetical protein L226DRAFT_39861 [Lentinus tigrinus ALCF2SS1-7]|uniref:uncharacterized protein n=1 Tax=Lentinus tigrinus ALCF2SS1-7 TaxID=1328758 RepID=UPI0011662D8D|nr:hypothetical protein L226DRAFT_39861 [Lentinus tigrinus ALCF2SS1-7]